MSKVAKSVFHNNSEAQCHKIDFTNMNHSDISGWDISNKIVKTWHHDFKKIMHKNKMVDEKKASGKK
jgi:hypothetical protein